MTYFTTLNKIRAHKFRSNGWEKLLRNLNKTDADDEPLSLVTILDSNGLNDAIWCLRACDGIEKNARLFAVWCARQMQHLMKDELSITALDISERYAHGNATDAELRIAYNAARRVLKCAARDAAWSAAWSAAECAAVGAEWIVELSAARGSEWDAAISALKAQENEFRRMFG